ncbi:MAG: HEAT repeat domain-containing protein, partial [Deltaproteobacteria bacterium]|nr:HEAT repeat domain-containing protein [Deltaproteobacteria bacterium]
MKRLKLLAITAWIILTAGCTLPAIRYPFASQDRVWFQKGVPQSTLISDLEACRSEGTDEYSVRHCMKAKGYLWLPRTEAELLQVRTLQEKGLEHQQIASELQWSRKKVGRYTDDGFKLGRIDALGRQPVDILASLGKPAVPQLIKQLHSHDPLSRRQAAQALGEIGDARAMGALIHLLHDPDALIQRHAAKGLGKIADPRAVGPLIAVLQDPGQEAHVKTAAAQALGRIGEPRAIAPLVRALEHPNWAVRSRA